MKKIFFTVFCFYSTLSFAQNGFFLQPEIGAGISNTSWRPSSTTGNYPGQNSIFSYQGQMDIGYKAGKWQFITGLGYLRTGVNLKQGGIEDLTNYSWVVYADANFLPPIDNGVTDYNPHYIIPVKIGYEVHRFSKRLAFTPLIGVELIKNMPRTFIINNQKQPEDKDGFRYNCNDHGFIGILQLNFEYRVSNHYDLTFGPSVHYMYTSELNFKDEHDYSVLMNLGLKWNFKKRSQNLSTTNNNQKKSL